MVGTFLSKDFTYPKPTAQPEEEILALHFKGKCRVKPLWSQLTFCEFPPPMMGFITHHKAQTEQL
jgi:hypothetical protein